jgi:hypothetical protein
MLWSRCYSGNVDWGFFNETLTGYCFYDHNGIFGVTCFINGEIQFDSQDPR